MDGIKGKIFGGEKKKTPGMEYMCLCAHVKLDEGTAMSFS